MIAHKFDLASVVRETSGFVGAELKAVVESAMFIPFMDGERVLDTEDLLQAAHDMVPLAKSHSQRIEELRDFVRSGLARNASYIEKTKEVELGSIRGERRREKGGSRIVDI